MKNFNLNTKNSEEWFTPPELIKALGEFDLDPCSPVNRPWDTAKKHYTKEVDGLKQKWEGRVWLNPPYGKETFKWIERLANHGDGTLREPTQRGFTNKYLLRQTAFSFSRAGFLSTTLKGEKGPQTPPLVL